MGRALPAMAMMSSGQAHGASGVADGLSFRLSTMRKKILSATTDKKICLCRMSFRPDKSVLSYFFT